MNDLEKQFPAFEKAWIDGVREFLIELQQTWNVGLLSLFDLADNFCWPHSYMPKWAENAESSNVVLGKALLELRSMMGSNKRDE